jgi:predicted O-methyltransferase YrrM
MITIDEIVERDLIKEIRTFSIKDDEDWDSDIPMKSFTVVSQCNRDSLLNYFSKLKDCKAILEIGVNDYEGCLSRVLIDNKNDETKYLGVDINPVPFTDAHKNQFGIQTDSANIDEIMSYANKIGITNFDLIFIDGWHSVNQVLKEWRFTEFLNTDGIVVFHDTNYHPGPKLFIDALDSSKFNIIKCCQVEDDYGIAFVTKK